MEDTLMHYGKLGMKWGIRRSRSDAAAASRVKEKRPNAKNMSDEELTDSVKRLNLEKVYTNLSKKPTKIERTKKLVDASSNALTQVQKINRESMNSKKTKEKLDLSKMTDQELRERINRTNLERQYNDMFAKETANISRGQHYASTILEVAGSALAITGSSLGIALAIKELRG